MMSGIIATNMNKDIAQHMSRAQKGIGRDQEIPETETERPTERPAPDPGISRTTQDQQDP